MTFASIQPGLEIRTSIADRIYEFYHLVDKGQAGSTADLFARDARLTFGPGSPRPGTIEGAAIRDAMVAREMMTSAFTRHAVTNLIFHLEEKGRVATSYLLILFRSDDETRSSLPAFVADVAETWTTEGEEWKILDRTISPTFSRS